MIYLLVKYTKDGDTNCLKFPTLKEAADYLEFAGYADFNISNFFDSSSDFHEDDFTFIDGEGCPDCRNGTAHKEGDEMSTGKSFLGNLDMTDETKIIHITDYKKKWVMN